MSDQMPEQPENSEASDEIISLQGMYQDYFLDYASYVILERAVPAVLDGLKPVQRRILHAMKEMDDGRYNKVANIIGQTMQYHPHGDAAIGDALVNMGQKELLIDTQGNWGNILTGDGAAASRYIEARPTKFALEIAFNPQTTEWQLSYDGRKREPIHLPVKFPLLLAQGAEGIAVGLSTKILPHNFIEIIEAAIKRLKNEEVLIYPDFQTGGFIDITEYQQGKRGSRVKVRAKIEKTDKNTLIIRELPFGVTTTGLIESIIKASDKGKIKIKQVVDNTAQDVEIVIDLASGVSPDITIDALFAFTDCEISIAPNACVIQNEKPRFLSVQDLLDIAVDHTKALLQLELEIKERELLEKWHHASLEKIFIENRIYHDIEECETWEAVLETISVGLKKYVAEPQENISPSDNRLKLLRAITPEDIIKLTEIKIKRISRYNTFQADQYIAQLEKDLERVRYDLLHLIDFTIAYYSNLLEKYGKGRERKTKIITFDAIAATEVVANNARLYANKADGFIGFGLKKDEFISDCSDIDDIIVFRNDGYFMVTRIAEKTFVGKDIIHVAVWKKNDERTTYNAVYTDGASAKSFVKRFNVTGITRDKEYPVTQETKGSKLHYFSVNPNGEAEIIQVQLSLGCKAKIKLFEFNFAELAIKGRSSQGNMLTKYPIRNIKLKSAGKSTIGALKIWLDEVSGKLNTEQRGRFLGEFDTGDELLILYKNGTYLTTPLDMTKRFQSDDFVYIGQCNRKEDIITAVHYDGHKGWTMVKRFHIETTQADQRFSYLTDHQESQLLFVSLEPAPKIRYQVHTGNKKVAGEVVLTDIVDIKGWKAVGNRLSDKKISDIEAIEPTEIEETPDLEEGQQTLF
ncbi:MAG: DNA gyrase/topoisomerase IV subunit A [Bacteroidetes bacterium]|nr:DNA gyrase/topoisomerase IV subunit A [Bacteroidota bacterium]